MKKIFKSFTFYFIILSILIIWMHQSGNDSKNISLIWLNPILRALAYNDTWISLMKASVIIPCRTIAGSISILWYVACVVTLALYGLFLDGIVYILKKILIKR